MEEAVEANGGIRRGVCDNEEAEVVCLVQEFPHGFIFGRR